IVVRASDHHGRVRSGIVATEGARVDVGTIELAPVEEGEEPALELAGIGAVLSAEGDAMVIGRVIEGGGAAEAGLVAGDAILEVEGVPVTTLGFGGTIERIRGPEGTQVSLRVRRASGAIEPIAVPRRRIRA
ncbi:MAG: PDZ domain-containing protein, partial [Sandaracinaceae bacterium]|nr:PDZ domain-containing protein [Sandaracinaceae bacterium]